MSTLNDGILILDYGSQYTLLIARRLRELGVYSEVWPHNAQTLDRLNGTNPGVQPRGVILSGGPRSVNDDDAPALDERVAELSVPILGICYGAQLLARREGGRVVPGESREYGRTRIRIDRTAGPFRHLNNGQNPPEIDVWMSHADAIQQLPDGYEPLARTENDILAAARSPNDRRLLMQFHPEVDHTEGGTAILDQFATGICDAPNNWTVRDVLETGVQTIRDEIGPDDGVICGLSGGVDSAVTAAMVHRAVGDQLTCVLVDHGLLRHREADRVRRVFEDHLDIDLEVVDAADTFFERLRGVTDPEEKRSIIGETFIDTFESVAERLESDAERSHTYLAQGTLYPDVIESMPTEGPSDTIKSHHNVGGLPERLDFELIEPLRELFKDEARQLGHTLGLPDEMIDRHPFPGPGLAIRVIGEPTRERVETVRQADRIFIEMLRERGRYHDVWQALAVLAPVRTVGVMGDRRSYDELIALRAVTSRDGMTADRADLPISFLGDVSDRIVNEVDGVNRVVYDVTSKPPATIEWE